MIHANFENYRTDDQRIVVVKSRALLELQQAGFDNTKPERLPELGLCEDGSAILWHMLYGSSFIGIDIPKRPPTIDYWSKELHLTTKCISIRRHGRLELWGADSQGGAVYIDLWDDHLEPAR